MSVVIVEMNETEEAAKERHFAEHPEDRDASNSLIVQLVDPTENTTSVDYHTSFTAMEARFFEEYRIDSNIKAAAIRNTRYGLKVSLLRETECARKANGRKKPAKIRKENAGWAAVQEGPLGQPWRSPQSHC